MTADQTQKLLTLFFSFMFGVCPITNATDKQKEAMKAAGIDFAAVSEYELITEYLLTFIK